jgi:protein involved in polysaccharide export with SLBB domain
MEFTINYREKIRVSVLGAVEKPGEYEMFKGDRFRDLLLKAGGVAPLGVGPEKNYFLKDGQRFFIKTKRE